jgi:hypothetical protein
MDVMMKDVMNCLNYLMDAMTMGVQKKNAELRDDQMADVSFYALPFRSPLLIFKYNKLSLTRLLHVEIKKGRS